jgi:hypothetical protein
VTEPQPHPETSLEDCLRRLRAVLGDLDALAPAVSLTVASATSGARRALAQEADANLGIVRQQIRETALRLDVASGLHRSALAPWIVDLPPDKQQGGADSPRTD